MCGITAFTGPTPPELVRRATRALSHRGPDYEGYHWDQRVALGHRHLRILGARQPLYNEDRSVVAVVNGEFYGHQELRSQLLLKGHRFSTNSDCEVLIHLYEEYGLESLESLCGEFAWILWDGRRLVAARDRFGIKPLVYARRGSSLWLASEAKALMAAGWPARWDRESLAQACSSQYLAPDKTLFEGIFQVPPGHLLIDQEKPRRYWDLPLWREGESEPLKALEKAVHQRLRGERPPAFSLSAGLDSSAVVALASSHLTPTCYTVAYPGHPWDETTEARELCRWLGARHRVVEVAPSHLLACLPEAGEACEGVAINGHLPAKYLLHQQVSADGFRAILTGEGADEVFGGYDFLESGSAHPNYQGVMLTRDQGLSTERLEKRLGFLPGFVPAKAALGRKLAPLVGLARECDYPLEVLGTSPTEKTLYLWCKTALANYILRTLGDGTEMAHSLEGRPPFLDHRVWWEAARLPVAGKVGKKWLRSALAGILPDGWRQRPKQPFLLPPLDCREYLLEPASIFDRQAVLASLEETGPGWSSAHTFLATATLLERAYGLSLR